MAKHKSILDRIESVALTKKITQTMKMVAASSLEKRKKEATYAEEYAQKMEAIIASLSPFPKSFRHPFLTKGVDKKKLLLVVGTDKGMCGSFLQSVLEEAEVRLKSASIPTEVLPIGKKTLLFFERKAYPFLTEHNSFQENLTKGEAFGDFLYRLFVERYTSIDIIYQSRGLSPKRESVISKTLLPLDFESHTLKNEERKPLLLEPSHEKVLQKLLPEVFTSQLNAILMHSYIAEQKARMVTMHQATENADAMLKELRVAYNRSRQAKITTEINEINAGAKFLNG